MINNGKQLEKIVLLIQQVFKDSENTTIYANHKLVTESGELREFDIVLQTEVNQFKLCIVIECKDHSRQVEAGLIEGFYGKCNRIKGINKMVFISSRGFQSGAVTAAKYYGIELYVLKEMRTEDIAQWIPLKQLDMGLNFHIMSLITNPIIPEGNGVILESTQVMYLGQNLAPILILDFLRLAAKQRQEDITEATMRQYVAHLKKSTLSKELTTYLSLEPEDAYIMNTDGRKISLVAIEVELKTCIVEVDADIVDMKTYKPIDGNIKAHYVKAKMGMDHSVEFILSKDKSEGFYSGAGVSSPILIQIKR